MTEPADYLATLETTLLVSEIIKAYTIVTARANTDDGYLRIRATLSNGDFLEASEYFVVAEAEIVTEDYRYQWMDNTRTRLRRRWDNTPHHPEVDGFPHHCHVGQENNVVSGEPLSLLELLARLESELNPD